MDTLITEDTEVKYQNEAELSYFDFEEETVSLYIKGVFAGDCKVWKDSEEDGREYITINHTIVYLDTLKRN